MALKTSRTVHHSSYELLFEAQDNEAHAVTGTMRINIASNFEAPPDLLASRAHLLAFVHMGEDWQRAGLALMDVRRIEETAISVMP